MAKKTIQDLLTEIQLQSTEKHSIIESVRALVKSTFPAVTEEVKYGGILFSLEVEFCGVFAYKEHVSVEFSKGAMITDSFGYLEGGGKGRRHLKFYNLTDISNKKLEHYLPLAFEAARNTGK